MVISYNIVLQIYAKIEGSEREADSKQSFSKAK